MRSLLALAMLGAAHACDVIQFDIKTANGAAHTGDWATKTFHRTSDQSGGRDVWAAQYRWRTYDLTKYLTWRNCNDVHDGWYFLSEPIVTNCNSIEWQMAWNEKVLSSEFDAQNIGTSAIRINNNAGGTITQTCLTVIDDCATNNGSTVTGELCACGDNSCSDTQYCDAGSCYNTMRCVEDGVTAATSECRCGGTSCETGEFCDAATDTCGPWAKVTAADACAICAENPVEYVQGGMC